MLPSLKHLLRTGRAYFPCAGLPPPKCHGMGYDAAGLDSGGLERLARGAEAVATEGGDQDAQTQATAAAAQPDGEEAGVTDGPGEGQEGGALPPTGQGGGHWPQFTTLDAKKLEHARAITCDNKPVDDKLQIALTKESVGCMSAGSSFMVCKYQPEPKVCDMKTHTLQHANKVVSIHAKPVQVPVTCTAQNDRAMLQPARTKVCLSARPGSGACCYQQCTSLSMYNVSFCRNRHCSHRSHLQAS